MSQIDSNQIKDAYDLLASESEERAPNKGPFLRSFVDSFVPRINPGGLVLDVGCGVGLASRAFLNLGFQVTGIDVSRSSLEFAARRNPEAIFVCQDFLEFKGQEIADAIFACAFIHLFDETGAKLVLQKMYSLLKDTGVVFLATDHCAISKEGIFEKPFYRKKVKRFKRYWARQELEELVSEMGFRVEESVSVPDYYRDFNWLLIYASKR